MLNRACWIYISIALQEVFGNGKWLQYLIPLRECWNISLKLQRVAWKELALKGHLCHSHHCYRLVVLWELNHYWTENWSAKATWQEISSLVNPSTKSILLIVSCQNLPQLGGSQAGWLHAQPVMGTPGGTGLEELLTGPSRCGTGARPVFLIVTLWGSLEFGKGEIIHMGKVSLI